MAKSVLELAVETGRWDAGIKKAQTALNNFTRDQGGLQQAMQKNGDKLQKFIQMMGNMDSKAKTAKGQMNDYRRSFEELSHAYQSLSRTEKASPIGKEMAKTLDKLSVKIRNTKKELEGMNKQLSGSSGGGLMGGNLMSGMNLGSIAKFAGVAGAATMALDGLKTAVVNNINVAKEFEQANANLASVLGTTRENIKELTDDALRLGASTQYTASQVTLLQTELAKLGFNRQEIIDSTEGILNFATATGSELPEAAALAGAALRAFGLDSSQMDRVVSTLAVGTTKSALSFTYLQNAMSTIAPVAKQANFQIEDVTALLGTLANSGFDASSAATATRNILLLLADSGSKLSKEFGKPIRNLDDLAVAMQGLQKKGVSLGEMFNLTDKRAVAAFATLVDGSGKLQALRDSVTDCNKELKKMVDERANTMQGALNRLSSAWEGFNLALNDSNGALKEMVDWLAGAVGKMTELAQATNIAKNAIKKFNDTSGSDNKSWKDEETRGQQIGAYNRRKKALDAEIAKKQTIMDAEYSEMNNAANSDYKRGLYKVAYDANKEALDALKAERNQLIAEGKKFFYGGSTSSTNTSSTNTSTGNGGGGSGSGKGKKTEYIPLQGSIDYYTKLAQEAQKSINGAATDSARVAAQNLYDEYQAKIKQLKDDLKARTSMEGVSVIPEVSLVEKLNIPQAKNEIIELEEELKTLQGLQSLNIIDEEQLARIDELTAKLKEAKAAIPLTPAEQAKKDADENAKAWSNASRAIGAAGSALQSIEDPGAKVMGTIAMAIANIAGTFASSLKGSFTPWDWIAGAAAGTATMISTIAAIKSATAGSYANGGVVGGSSYYGDKLYARVNSGEAILNNNQSKRALEMMDSGGGVRLDSTNLHLSAEIGAESLRFIMNSNGKRTGRGEIAYSH